MTALLPQQVLAYIRSHELLHPGERILVGVSGGPDSTALLHLLHRLAPHWPLTLGVAHFDHGLRGAASRADARWVEALAARLGLPFHPGRGEVRQFQQEQKLSRQAAARRLRLSFFQQVRQEHHYQKLALGHTADDQVELFFLRLLRGTGPEGLKGMWPANPGGLIRPLLGTSKDQLLAWLTAEGLTFRLDRSNASRVYRRNQLRLDLVPQLLAYNPRLGEAVTRLQTLLQEQEDYLSRQAAAALAALLAPGAEGPVRLPVAGLLALDPALQKRVLRLACVRAGVPLESLRFVHLQAAVQLCQRREPGGQLCLPGRWRLVREGQELVWHWGPPPAPLVPADLGYFLPDQEAGTFSALGWTFTWSTTPAAEAGPGFTHPPTVALMDRGELQFPLQLRTFRAGDRFRPLGLAGSKKLQDFFVDARIPRAQRPCIPLLVSGGQIVWVVGHRLADPVKVSPHTRTLLVMRAAPAGP